MRSGFQWILVSVLLSAMALFGGAQRAAAALTSEQNARLSVEQVPLAQVAVPVVGNLSVTGQFDQATYVQGGFAKLSVAVGQPNNQVAYIGLVQAYPDGRVVKLFPHRYQPNNVVVGNNRFEILGGVAATGQLEPRGLFVNDPSGTYLVKLIASTDAAALNSLLSITRAGELTRRLQAGNYVSSGTVWSVDGIAYAVSGNATQPLTSAPPPMSQAIAGQPVMAQPVVMPGLGNLTNMTSDFDLGIHTKDNRSSYRVGEEMVFQLSAGESCELGLVEIGPTNELEVLFPNPVEKIKLKKNRVAWVPSRGSAITLKPDRVGTHTYLAVCSRKPGFWESLFGSKSGDERTLGLKPTTTVADLLKDDPDGQEARAYISVQVMQ